MKLTHFLIVFLLFPFFGGAQILDSLAIYDHKEFENQTLKVFSDSGLIQLQVVKPSLIKVSFSKRNVIENKTELSSFDSTYVRITQNLESIFMQTDSLLIVISKLDFSIRFQNLREQVYTVHQNISFVDEGLNFKFSKTQDEDFYNYKGKRLKAKKYSIQKVNTFSSSKEYIINFADNASGKLSLREASFISLKILNAKHSSYWLEVF